MAEGDFRFDYTVLNFWPALGWLEVNAEFLARIVVNGPRHILSPVHQVPRLVKSLQAVIDTRTIDARPSGQARAFIDAVALMQTGAVVVPGWKKAPPELVHRLEMEGGIDDVARVLGLFQLAMLAPV